MAEAVSAQANPWSEPVLRRWSSDFEAFVRRQPPIILTATGVLLVVTLGVFDYLTGPDLSFLIFYIGPVLLLVWYVGRTQALFATVLSAACWTFEDVLSEHAYKSLGIGIWNVAVRLGFFVLFVQVVYRLKTALEEERAAEQRRLEQEIDIARVVQMRLLPRSDPGVPGLDCHAVCRPARGVSGDYYDYLGLGDAKLGIAVGDVVGKGISAALLMASLQASFRSFASIGVVDMDMSAITSVVNRQMYLLTEPNRFATLFWAVYDERRASLAYVNAGHCPAFVLRSVVGGSPQSGRPPCVVERLPTTGLPLGVLEKARFRSGMVSLRPGDLVALFTDGVTEAFDAAGSEFGEARLENVLRDNARLGAAALCRVVLEAVDDFRGDTLQQDDATLLIARVLPHPASL
jgi:serine phosphatase RsbU (regulator of sigma subunit)